MQACSVCTKQKTALMCSQCQCLSCKKCSIFIDESRFEFLSLLPESLQDKIFCPDCFAQEPSSELALYEDTLERAKNVDVYLKDQGKETRLMRRIEKPIRIKDCEDKEELLLQLAFVAAQKGYSTIVDVDLRPTKVGKGTYKKQVWAGSAVPIDTNKRR